MLAMRINIALARRRQQSGDADGANRSARAQVEISRCFRVDAAFDYLTFPREIRREKFFTRTLLFIRSYRVAATGRRNLFAATPFSDKSLFDLNETNWLLL